MQKRLTVPGPDMFSMMTAESLQPMPVPQLMVPPPPLVRTSPLQLNPPGACRVLAMVSTELVMTCQKTGVELGCVLAMPFRVMLTLVL